ncbi:MAG: cell wall-binding repeat-containing protein [Acidimicrobiales bacterium]
MVVFAPGFVIPASPIVGLGSAFTGCTGSTTASTSATTVTITVGAGCTLAPAVSATLTVEGVTNPPAGSYANTKFSVTADSESAGSPAAAVVITAAPDGTGTMSVSPSSVAVGSSGDTFVFTYTTAPGGLNSGELKLTVPPGWSPPSVSLSAPGDVTSTCGMVSVASSSIVVSGVTLASGSSCTITYGSQVGGGPGVFAPSAPNTYPFSALEMSTASGTLTALASSPALSTGSPSITPIYGVDAIGTSIAISQAEFPIKDSAGGVVLARDDFFSDALAGGPLAAAVNGPLLITEGAPASSTLDPRVLSEIQRVLPIGKTVYILGGNLALSPNIDASLEALGYQVVREAGADEYATAVDIAEQLGNPTTIFEATGLGFYDALSAVPAAIEEHGAILLTDGSSEPFETYAYIVEHPGDTRFAIGGPLAAGGADAGATAIYGQDLFNTSTAVANYFFPHPSVFGAATAAEFPDALGGGVFMATGVRLGPILLVNPGSPLPPEITPYLATLAASTKAYVFGGPLAVGPDVVTALQLAIG